jgi:L-ribulokinase
LSSQAALLPINFDNELAIDWFNGRRTPDANQELKGAIMELSLGSDAPRVFRALVEATCFGAKSIVERFIDEGIPVKGIIGIGGVAKKSPFVMQMMADILGMPIRIIRSQHTCALGAAMFAAVVAGIYPDIEAAMPQMSLYGWSICSGIRCQPIHESGGQYQRNIQLMSRPEFTCRF